MAGNVFYAQTGLDDGFMVYDPVINNFIEKSASLSSPYDFSTGHDNYYFGPMNYFERVGDEFYSLLDDTCVSLDYAYQLQDIFNSQLETFRTAQSEEAYQEHLKNNQSSISPMSVTIGNKTYVDNYQIIRDCVSCNS